MADETDEPIIRYSVRDLLDHISTDMAAGFARVETGLKDKADKADLAEIRGELTAHGLRLAALELHRDEGLHAAAAIRRRVDTRDNWLKFLIPTVITAVATVILLIQAHVF